MTSANALDGGGTGTVPSVNILSTVCVCEGEWHKFANYHQEYIYP